MQLDFTQLKSKFEALTSLRPMPHREYVELYIKAYYLPENSLEEWIREHKVFKYIYFLIYLTVMIFLLITNVFFLFYRNILSNI